jgi:hypothetical protein
MTRFARRTRTPTRTARWGTRYAFDRVSLDVPWIEVNTTDAYQPGLREIVAFANGPG